MSLASTTWASPPLVILFQASHWISCSWTVPVLIAQSKIWSTQGSFPGEYVVPPQMPPPTYVFPTGAALVIQVGLLPTIVLPP